MADLQFVVSALDKATAALLKITAQLDKVGDKLDKLDGKVAKLTVALDDKASPGLDNVERKVKRLDGQKATVKVEVDKSLGDSLIKISLLGRALKALALPASAVAVAPQVAAIGAAAVAAVGAIGLLPGVIGAAGLAAGVASVSFGGLLKYFTASSDKKKKEAFDALSASGQHLAIAIKELTPRFDDLRHATQDAVFEGLNKQVKPLADIYFPMLRAEMVRVGDAFNVASLSLVKFFEQKKTAADLQGALHSMQVAVTNVLLAAKPLAQAFVDIFVTSTARLPALTKGIGDAAARFAGFIRAARETGQLGAWIDKGVQTVKLLGQTVGNVGSIILSVFRSATVEGGNLVQKMAEVTGRVADLLKSAKGQEALKAVFDTIRAAIAAVTPVVEALAPLLGTVLVAAGKTLVTVFQALGPPLRDVANALSKSLAPVLPAIAEAFGQIALAIVPMIMPVTALIPAFDSLAKLLAEAAKVAAEFFSAFAGTSAAIFKTILPLIKGAADALTGLLHVIEPIAPALGVAAAAFVAFKTASAGLSAVQDVIKGAGQAIAWAGLRAGEFTTAVTGSAVAGEKLAAVTGGLNTGLRLVSTTLPVIAVAAAAAAFVYDQLRDKSDELAKSVVDGQRSMSAAVAEQTQQLNNQDVAMAGVTDGGYAMGEAIGGATGAIDENAQAAARSAQAHGELKAKLEAQLAVLPPLEAAQQRVKIAQEEENYQIAQFGPNSQQAITAHGDLVRAKDDLKRANDDAAEAEKSLGERVLDTQQIMAGAANADLGYQQSLLTLKDAQRDYTKAVEDHGVKSDEAAQADIRLQRAHLDAASAAAEKAGKEAEAAGITETSTIKAQAFKDELLRQAATMTGPSRDALIALANGTLDAGKAADAANRQAEGYRSQLDLLGQQATGPTKAALEQARQKLEEVAKSHGTAQQKADDQRRILVTLQQQAEGPTKLAIQRMIDEIDLIHDKAFRVTGTGEVRPTLLSSLPPGHSATGGILGVGDRGVTVQRYADGGVTPGYTPGRDVHRYQAANGSVLELSGGEAVMRPEWTKAVSPQYVHAANAAARSGGVAGVTDFIGRTAPHRAGEGSRGDGNTFARGGIYRQQFATGGVVLDGTQPFKVIPQKVDTDVTNRITAIMAPIIAAQVRALEAQLAGGVSGVAGGGAQAALAWARTQVGKPYIWGAVGPRGYDCSGFMSAVTNVMRGRNPYSRVGATGSFPWAGFAPGLGGQFAIGAFRGNPGHMAGTLAPGVNVESSGGVGVRVGGGARGAANGMFNIRGHIGDQGGMLRHGEAVVNLSGSLERVLSPPETRSYNRGGDNGALLAAVQGLRAELRGLRGDVDHHGDQAAIAGELRGLRYQLASTGSASMSSQAARTASELGAWA